MVEHLVEFLDSHGGSFDFGKFSAEFPGFKKRQLEPHFDFVAEGAPGSGRWIIRLSEAAGGERPPATRVEGRILFYDRAKGYGFVNCDEESGDVFFPRGALPKDMQEAPPDGMRGLEVSFDLYQRADGKPRADRLIVLGGAAPRGGADRGADAGEVVIGRVVRYEEAKGYGFIEPDGGGEDVFFLRGETPPEMAGCRRKEDFVDARLEFEVEVRADGKRRAKQIVLLEPPPGRGGGRPRERSRSRDRGGAPGANRATGRIVRFDRSKGYGFITCPDEPEDIFFLPSSLPKDLQDACRSGEGGILDMEVDVDFKRNEEGKPRATRVVPLFAPGPGDRRLHVGTIVAFDPVKGFGFLKPDDVGEDVFFLRGELPPELAGCQKREEVVDRRVECEVRSMPDGKLRAHQLVILPPPRHGGRAGPPRDGGPRPSIGRIRKFDRSKGYGFIEAPGEADVFFLPSALPKELQDSRESLDGMDVTFEFHINEDGKPRATHLKPFDPRMGYWPMPPPGFMGHPMAPPPPPLGPPPMGMPMMGPMGPMGPMMAMGPMGPVPMPPMGAPMPMDPEAGLHIGTVVSYDAVKAFGFINSSSFQEDVFFLRSELPNELRETEKKEKVINQQVEFEVKKMPDGKFRARRMVHVPAGRQREKGRRDGEGRGGKRRAHGTIARYDKSKGYGFIACDIGDNVFFLRSSLPKDLQEAGIDELKDLEVFFKLYANEEGKPRADNLELMTDEERDKLASGAAERDEDAPVRTGEVHSGVILRFDPGKGYGFIKPDDLDEDVFFQRSEMPPEIAASQRKDEVEHQQVQFEMKTMPDGKLRAQRIELLIGGALAPEGRDEPPEPPLPALEEELLQQMVDFLVENGGGCDYGRFASRFPKVKKKQLSAHFDVFNVERGVQRIELPKDAAAKAEEAATMGLAPEAGAEADENEVPPDEPAIPLRPGCQPVGVIRAYDPSKGFGFIRCEGMEEDVFFPRQALPEDFQIKRKKELPELVGVQASCEMEPSTDRGPRAQRVTLLLRWHATDRCWLLRRS